MARMAPRKLPEALTQKPSSPVAPSPTSPLSVDPTRLQPNSHSAPTSAVHSSANSDNDLSPNSSGQLKSPSSPTKAAGRAGMVRTTLSASVIQAGAQSHAAVMGRGYNKFTSIQQNDRPFLPGTSLFPLTLVQISSECVYFESCNTNQKLKQSSRFSMLAPFLVLPFEPWKAFRRLAQLTLCEMGNSM